MSHYDQSGHDNVVGCDIDTGTSDARGFAGTGAM